MEKEQICYNLPGCDINIITFKPLASNRLRDIHFHREIELVCVQSGLLKCTVDNDEVTLSPHDAVLINKGTMHKLECLAEGAVFTYIQFDIDKLSRLILPEAAQYLYMFKNETLKYYVDKEHGELYRIISDLIDEASKKQAAYDIYIKLNILKTIAFMSRYGLLPSFDSIDKQSFKKMLPIAKFINENYVRQITLDDICKETSFSKFYLCHLFKSITGLTFTEHLNHVRLNHVEEQLANTNKSIYEIALDCGFSSTQNFNITFKKYKKCTPGYYRKSLKGIT